MKRATYQCPDCKYHHSDGAQLIAHRVKAHPKPRTDEGYPACERIEPLRDDEIKIKELENIVVPTSLTSWLRERLQNCLRIAALKDGEEKQGWLEDAAYFRLAINAISDLSPMVNSEWLKTKSDECNSASRKALINNDDAGYWASQGQKVVYEQMLLLSRK